MSDKKLFIVESPKSSKIHKVHSTSPKQAAQKVANRLDLPVGKMIVLINKSNNKMYKYKVIKIEKVMLPPSVAERFGKSSYMKRVLEKDCEC